MSDTDNRNNTPTPQGEQSYYSYRNAIDIAEMNLPQPQVAWGGIPLVGGFVAEIIGPPSIGKSRLILVIAIMQIIGRTFPNAEYKGNAKPQTWLFFGTENSIRRWQNDLRKICVTLTKDEKELLRTHLFLPTLENADDSYMRLDDDTNFTKCCGTVQQVKPDIIVFDPWGDLCPSELADDVQRDTVRKLRKIARSAGNQNVPVIILNHSRMGADVYAKAVTDGGNYGRNSKAIFGQCRAVFNLRPVYTEHERLGDAIEIIDAKHNDRRGFAPVAIELDPETMLYHALADFNHDAVQAAWEAAVKGKRKTNAAKAEHDAEREAAKQAKDAKVRETLDAALKNLFNEPPGYWDSETFKARLMERSGLGKSVVESYIANRVADWKNRVGGGLKIAEQRELKQDANTGKIKEGTARSGFKLLKGSPEAIARYVAEFEDRNAKA